MTNELSSLLTQEKILKAFDKADKKSILEICRVAGVSPRIFYYHTEKYENFRARFESKQREYINQQLAEI